MFINVLNQIIILFILILIGFILTKCKILNDISVKSMTDLVLIFVTPCVIISSFMRKFEASALKNLLICFLIAFLAHIGFITISKLFIRDADKSKEKVLKFASIFSNCGYMSLPLQKALLGDNGIFFGSAFIAIFNLFIWSYGILLMSGDKKYITPKKVLINPGIIGVTIGLILFLFSIKLPLIISEPINYLASLNTPLPMIIIGFHLANKPLHFELKNFKMILSILFKLIIFPLITLGVMYLCGIRGDMLVSITISCSAPTAAITTMFASKFKTDVPLSVDIVSLSTILSLFTIPPIVTLAQYIA